MRKKLQSCLVLMAIMVASPANAVVVINEVFINPPGSLDDTAEYIELMGTPGKKLDGYAIAFLAGGMAKYYPLDSIPPIPGEGAGCCPEIDEFFSLDGLSLGANGLLVIAHGADFDYPTVLSDTNLRANWEADPVWNGLLDTPGRLENDASMTILLIRNRPGITEADPANPAGLRWGKDIAHDAELIRPVIDPQDGMMKDQWGDGNLDKGQPNGLGGNTLDLKGALTLGTFDDLEVVDEVSYESERGWEYDVDGRHVDDGSSIAGLPYRHVHALDDPQGFNPDALTRVDYRTKGPGWTPAAGATGEMGNGNNWQDTATEQWIRGESTVLFNRAAGSFDFYYDNSANTNPDSIQPFIVNVPLWLNDGVGTNYDFTSQTTYPIMAGRVNPLSIPFIPGDADRDGDCDTDDIAKIAAVFGDDDWIFSNSFADAPEGDDGDPAAQTRPWDVDATGDNGIEASDLQWALNFQGSTNGRVVGVRYDSTTPSATGVFLNSNASVACTVTLSTNVPSGNPLDNLSTSDVIEVTVSGRVTAGAITTINQQNGIMQYVHDALLDMSGVLKIASVQALSPYNTTRASLMTLDGVSGDLGARRINGHTTNFVQGLTSAVPLYRITLQPVGLGTTTLSIAPATEPKFAASTPFGLKVGRTNHNGNPSGAAYPAGVTFTVTTSSLLAPNAETGGFAKNRYISFEPNNAGVVAFRVTKTGGPGAGGVLGWVAEPGAVDAAKIVATPVFRVWDEAVVHVGDCPVIPLASYEIEATTDGVVFSDPLPIVTISQPGAGKFWGDTVGSFDGFEWSGPNGLVNANDFLAALQTFQLLPQGPSFSVVDVQSVSSIDPCLNRIVNIADVFLLLQAFQGNTYPFTTNPGSCPVCP